MSDAPALMTQASAVVVAGAFGIDTNVYAVGARVGAEVTFAHVVDGPGQAGCYSAFAFAALGLPTRAIAALGTDRCASWIRDELVARSIRLTELRDAGGTHRSVNIVAQGGSRLNWFDARGSSEVIVDLEACRVALRGARLLHSHLDDWCRQLLPLAREEGLVISCDLQDAPDAEDAYRTDFVEAADILFLSAVNLADPRGVALDLAARRSGRLVIIGAGADGCIVGQEGVILAQQPPQVTLPVLDTNGAGDTLAATFLAGHVIDGLPLERAVLRAQLAARLICSQPGDAKAPPDRETLDALERSMGSA